MTGTDSKETEIARAALDQIAALHGVSGTNALTRLTLTAAELVDPGHVNNVIAEAVHAADAALYLSAFALGQLDVMLNARCGTSVADLVNTVRGVGLALRTIASDLGV